MEVSEFVSRLTRNSSALLDSEQNKIYYQVYNSLPTKEKVFNTPLLKGNDYHLAHHLFDWQLCCKIIEPIYNNNGMFCGNNIYFYKL